MAVDVAAVSGGRKVVWSWCGTCTRGGSNKYYLGVVVENADGTFDGICAGAVIGAPPRIYPQVQGVAQDEAVAKVQKQVGTKKKEYADAPDFLVGIDSQAVVAIRGGAEAGAADADAYFRVIWPMLAPNDTPQAKLEEAMQPGGPWVVEEKYDGMRLIGQIGPTGTRYTSRGASVNDPTRPIEKTDALPHMNVRWPESLWGAAIDGELIQRGGIAHDVSGNLHAKDGRDKTDLIMVLYDLPMYQGRDLTDSGEGMPFRQRRELLQTVFEQMMRHWLSTHDDDVSGFPFKLTKQHTLAKDKFLEFVLANGGEGIMLKHLDGLYVQGKRPANTMYKVKKATAEDVVVVGFTRGKGKYATQIGAIRFGQYLPASLIEHLEAQKAVFAMPYLDAHPNPDYQLVELGQVSGMTDALRAQMTANLDAYLGRVMTITAMERLKGGTFRHPQFKVVREIGDKSPFECVWEGPKEN